MSENQFAPGYYDDGSGTQRYWDGRGWTQQTRPAPSRPAPSSPPAPSRAVEPAPSAEGVRERAGFIRTVDRLRPRTRNLLIVGAAAVAFLVGIGMGAAGHSSDDAEAAAAKHSAGTVATSSPTATPVAAETVEPTDSASEPVETAEPTEAPEVTTHGVTESDAMLACAQYGDVEFPYGFKDHSILGNIAQYIEKNRWFIKHEVTITNEFDAKRDTVFECTVGGTHSDPEVKSFYVYP